MRIFVLGHRGMLGHVVTRVLSEAGHEIVTTSCRYEGDPHDPLVESVRASGCDWVVNAAGRIKQKSKDSAELFLANTLLPLHLGSALGPDQRLIHASTDCVFSGRRGRYRVDDEPDPLDVYGLSKLLGEAVADPPRCTVIRTSIIGPELPGGGYGLMDWFLGQDGPVRGFTDHFWNGITTLEWARVCLGLIAGEKGGRREGVIQPGATAAVSKCELLQLMAETWDHRIAIDPVASGSPVDRTLVPTLVRPELEQQLRELRAWYAPEPAGP